MPLDTATNLNRENLNRMLSERGNPEWASLGAVLDALGLKVTVESKRKKRKRSA